MKKLLFIAAMLLSLCAKAQHPYMRVYFADSVLNNELANFPLSQVAISGYYDNLLHIPNITIGGVTHAVTDGQSWVISGSTVPTPAIAKTANYTILSTDFTTGNPTLLATFDCTSGNLTATLPSAATFAGYTIKITKTDASGNTVTISGLTGDNVIGTQKWMKELVSDGTNWRQN